VISRYMPNVGQMWLHVHSVHASITFVVALVSCCLAGTSVLVPQILVV
jgi:hypothetical protein